MLDMRLHEKLQRLCTARRWGQTDLIAAVGDISKSTMNNWWSGKTKPDVESAFKIAKVLDVSLDWLVDERANFPPPEGVVHPDAIPPGAAVLKLIRALELDEEEALRRLATPLVYSGEAWLPGSVRDLTPGERARYRQARRAGPKPEPEPEDEEDLGDPALGNPPTFRQDHPPKPPKRKGG